MDGKEREQRWTFEATEFPSRACKGFDGFGEADPSNVSPWSVAPKPMASASARSRKMRVAETRAVNRALRSPNRLLPGVEEGPTQAVNGNRGGTKVRGRLCQLIRQQQLDANLVKAYATDFCGTNTLCEAAREQVQRTSSHT